jgi:hypothetical protein
MDFLYKALISPVGNYIESENVTWDEERSSTAAMGGGGGEARVFEPKKTGVLSARALSAAKPTKTPRKVKASNRRTIASQSTGFWIVGLWCIFPLGGKLMQNY